MSEIVDADGMVRQIKDVDLSGGTNSPKASVYMAESAGKALAVVALALGVAAFGGVLVFAIMMNGLVDARTEAAAAKAAEVAQALAPLQNKVAQLDVYAWQQDRETRVQKDRIDRIEIGLGKRGININTDGH